MTAAEDKLWSYALGALAVAAALAWWKKRGGIVEAAREFEAATEYEGGLPQNAPGVGSWEQAFGAAARIFGQEPPPSVSTVQDRPADDRIGPFLDRAKNALGVAGKVRFPANGTRIDLSWGTGTIEADAALENQSSEERLGQVRARIVERKGSSQEMRIVDGPFVRLAPGEFRTVLMRVPLPYSGFGTDPDSSQVSVLFSNYTLDTSVFTRD